MTKTIHLEALSYSLITEGTSDAVFIPILKWLFKQYGITATCEETIAGSGSLIHKIQLALKTSPVDLLFIHRDADQEQPIKRREEIAKAVELSGNCSSFVPIIPIRMTEAWLLFDADALRKAVGNSGNKPDLSLPAMKTIETLADPKQTLFELLRAARPAETRRKRKKARQDRFNARHKVARQINDFSPLRQLRAFRALEQDLCAVLGLESKER